MICVSIHDVSFELAAQYAREYPFVEFRLETLPVSIEEAGLLFSIAKRSVATCRPLGTEPQRRIQMLEAGLKNEADFVDIEIDAKDQLLEKMGDRVHETGSKLIVSYHNFERTPEEGILVEVYETACKYKADIVKIACSVHCHEDNLRLLSLCLRYPSLLVIGMGPVGRISRLFAPFLGSPFTFACPDDQPESAPGQLPYSKMKNLQKELQEYFYVRT